ncbi:acyl-CoA thioester hydrolase [Alteribacillus persepolensis]|uniref:Acyl-CoA thioester hydrolase n=1 Tax=Alteribacillus persepolensis TaxID=568899 RepID=A0A1G8ITR0_9BACI|nr:thioesterase family protein [Alteribacillus persepolensis]SDI22435.1 acyl-CoA thioester hydrolase [Alteribacillus persepolensis]
MNKSVWEHVVPQEWVDYNGHMNDAAYSIAFSQALDAFIDQIGIDDACRTEYHYTIFTLETHVLYLAEVHRNENITINLSILERDAKRMHLFFEMTNEAGELVATSEQMTMGMDQKAGRPAPFPDKIAETISTFPHVDRDNWPKQAGRSIGLKKK